MRKLILIPLVAMLALGSCASYKTAVRPDVPVLLQSGKFTFQANRVNITNPDVVNVLSAMGGSYSRAQDLQRGYFLELNDSMMSVHLPYFGRMYTPTFDNSRNSFDFETEDFTVSKALNKKGNAVYTIKVNDKTPVKSIFMEIYKDGRGYLSVDALDRQPISYDGEILENFKVK